MQQFTSAADQRAWSRAAKIAGKRIAFVPTMGALHEGHLSLVRLAREQADQVVVSIFVNPTQFDNPDDLAAYPRTLEQDRALLSGADVDALYLPSVEATYPNGYCTFIDVVGPLTDKLCAVARPGHFRGVCTVVTKLFHAVEPDTAVFGQKDLQQVLIVGRMIRDLDFPIELVIGPTLREADGLAMSSRNRRLSTAARAKALGLPRGLNHAIAAFKTGERSSLKLIEHVANELLVHDGVDLDYCDVISLQDFSEREIADPSCVLAAAVFVDGVRLIDHVHLASPGFAVAGE